MCPPSYHYSGFVATHALGYMSHMIYIYISPHNYSTKHRVPKFHRSKISIKYMLSPQWSCCNSCTWAHDVQKTCIYVYIYIYIYIYKYLSIYIYLFIYLYTCIYIHIYIAYIYIYMYICIYAFISFTRSKYLSFFPHFSFC